MSKNLQISESDMQFAYQFLKNGIYHLVIHLTQVTSWSKLTTILILICMNHAQCQGDANYTTHESIVYQAKLWLSIKSGSPIDSITVAPPDRRLKLPICTDKLIFELPFNHFHSIRAQCKFPSWDVFLQSNINNLLSSRGSNTQNLDSPNNSSSTRKVLVLVRPYSRGSIIASNDIEVNTVLSKDYDSSMLNESQSIEQMEAQRDLIPGVPIRITDIRPARMIRQGQDVLLVIGDDSSGFKVSVRVEALQDAKLGDRVQLKNRETNKTITGIVTGPNTAKGL